MNTKSKIKLAALAAVMGAGAVTTSSAWAFNEPFTLTPNLASPSLTTNTGTITADTLHGTDNATITVTSVGNGSDVTASEAGQINWTGASLGLHDLTAAELAGLNSGGADNWNMTADFTANQGVFSYANLLAGIYAPIHLDFTLNGITTSLTTFTLATASTDGGASLGNPINPNLAVSGTFTIAPGEGPGAGTFFTSPDPFYITVGASATSFAQGNITTDCATDAAGIAAFLAGAGSCTVNIVKGGVVGGFTVPEPETIGLMGIGLVGLWFGRRKLRS